MRRSRTQTDNPADALAFRAAREVCRRHAKDLYFASAFLPRAKRDAAHAVYAFGRMIGAAIDADDSESPSVAARLRHQPLGVGRVATPSARAQPGSSGSCCSSHPLDQRLALFRERLNDLYEGTLELPTAGRSEEQHVLHAFAVSARRYQIPRQYFLDLAEGYRMDQAVCRYATWASLERYCRHAGGAAGAIAACVFGVTHSGAAEFAVTAGKAMRLTAILRDLGHDAGRGRVYLPLEDLATFRYSERELLAGSVNENFRKLMGFEVARARAMLREAAAGLRWVAGDGSRGTAATLLAWHLGLLDRIERRGYDVFRRRPALGAAEKLRLLPLARRLARRGSDAAVPSSISNHEPARLAPTS